VGSQAAGGGRRRGEVGPKRSFTLTCSRLPLNEANLSSLYEIKISSLSHLSFPFSASRKDPLDILGEKI
jgi:hypothetical protein